MRSAELIASRALREAVADPAVRSVVITGAGKAFSAGADLNEMKAARQATFQERGQRPAHLEPVLRDRAGAEASGGAHPGAGNGGAVGIISACDVSIAASGISFVHGGASGIAPAMISPFVIRRVGPRAQRLFLTARRSARRRRRFA